MIFYLALGLNQVPIATPSFYQNKIPAWFHMLKIKQELFSFKTMSDAPQDRIPFCAKAIGGYADV